MSDSEGDISDELLELAGATEKKRKKSQAKSSMSKRHKADVTAVDSDVESPESEEDEEESNPYPLEGKYIDEADRQRLMQMSEIEREDILAQRQEEMQRIQDKRNLDQMLKAQSGQADDSVSNAAKRQHSIRGVTKEKSRKLDELKAKRKAKDEKKRTRTNSPKRDASMSPVDMEMSDDEEEDGQITRYDEQEERERKILDKVKPEVEEPITREDLETCRLTRDQLAKYSMSPHFDEIVKGAWVRFLIGDERGTLVYRVCEVADVPRKAHKPYKLNDKMVDQEIQLRYGESTKWFVMDKVSNGPIEQTEFDRAVRVWNGERVKLPLKRQLEKKAAQIHKLANALMTESDIAAMLARKNMLQASNKQSPAGAALERSRLAQARTLATRRQDWDEVAEIDRKLAELATSMPQRHKSQEESRSDILAKVNERNRKANLEAVRRAETQEAERKRRERKLLAANGGTPRSATPADPSARLKTTPKTFSPRPDSSAPGTPSFQADGATPRSVSPLPPLAVSTTSPSAEPTANFEASIIQSVDIDLGDF